MFELGGLWCGYLLIFRITHSYSYGDFGCVANPSVPPRHPDPTDMELLAAACAPTQVELAKNLAVVSTRSTLSHCLGFVWSFLWIFWCAMCPILCSLSARGKGRPGLSHQILHRRLKTRNRVQRCRLNKKKKCFNEREEALRATLDCSTNISMRRDSSIIIITIISII